MCNSSPNVSQSSPPIALLPGGPEVERDRLLTHRPIDDIIKAVVASGKAVSYENKVKRDDENEWPFISDKVFVENGQWVKCEQITTDVGVRIKEYFGFFSALSFPKIACLDM